MRQRERYSISTPSQPAPQPDCALCGDTGRWTGKLVGGDGTERIVGDAPCPAPGCKAGARERVADEQARIARHFGAAQIPELYEAAALSDFAERLSCRAETLRRDRRGLFITGPVGTGKTHLAIAVLRASLAAEQSGLFLTLPTLLRVIRSTWDRRGDGPTERELIDTAASVDWLVLDDVGVEVASPWVQQEVYEVINARYVNRRPIVCTSNATTDELAQADRLGERTVSRLRQMCEVITLTGADRRLRGLG
jgi:DNA replication protein DnaC